MLWPLHEEKYFAHICPRRKITIISSVPKFSDAFGSPPPRKVVAEPLLYTLVFAFYCRFKKQFFRTITFLNHFPKTRSGKILTPYTKIFACHCIIKKQFFLKITKFFKTTLSASFLGASRPKTLHSSLLPFEAKIMQVQPPYWENFGKWRGLECITGTDCKKLGSWKYSGSKFLIAAVNFWG